MVLFQNNILTDDDKLFFVYDLRRLINERTHNDNTSTINSITKLAQNGQIESLEYFYSTLPANKREGSVIFGKIQNIITNPKKKTPREYMAIAEYYKWNARRNKDKEKIYDDYMKLYEENKNACISLLEEKKLDITAQEYLLEYNAPHNKNDSSYRYESNFRNKLDGKIHSKNSFILPEAKARLFYAYARNLILFADNHDYSLKINEVEDFIKSMRTKTHSMEQKF